MVITRPVCVCLQVISPEKAEEAKLKARYPHLGAKPGGSDFLRKRLQKGVSPPNSPTQHGLHHTHSLKIEGVGDGEIFQERTVN